MNNNLLYKTAIAGGILITLSLVTAGFLYYSPESEDDSEYSNEVWHADAPQHEVHINPTPELPFVDSGKVDRDGKPIAVRCNTCHSTKEPNIQTNKGSDLKEFHQGLHFNHGTLNCTSCHNPEDYESLRLANGTSIPFSQTIQLCTQCHGTQYRDYKNGSHGGMTGYWDLGRGSRQRNTCTDCHAPHAPDYPQVMPVFPPKVREGSKLPETH